MPREAPVTRAIREARVRDMKVVLSTVVPAECAIAHGGPGPIRRDGHDETRRAWPALCEQRRPGVMGPRVRGDDQAVVSSPQPAATAAAAAVRSESGR